MKTFEMYSRKTSWFVLAVALLAAFIGASQAIAQTAQPAVKLTLTWVAPTKRTDGTNLLASEIKEYQVFDTTGATPTNVYTGTALTTSLSFTMPTTGTFTARRYYVIAVDTKGFSSAPSTVATSASVSTPAAPTGVTATVEAVPPTGG